jgi:hypothetical protein
LPDCSEAQCPRRPSFPHWGSLSAELLKFNIRVGTNIAKYWRGVAEFHVAAFMPFAVARETPTDRRRKFTVIEGGKT